MTPEIRTRHRALSIIDQVSRESLHVDSSLYVLVCNNICSSPVMFLLYISGITDTDLKTVFGAMLCYYILNTILLAAIIRCGSHVDWLNN